MFLTIFIFTIFGALFFLNIITTEYFVYRRLTNHIEHRLGTTLRVIEHFLTILREENIALINNNTPQTVDTESEPPSYESLGETAV